MRRCNTFTIASAVRVEHTYLGAFKRSMSACFPISMEPYRSDSPREAAALSVEAIRASGIVMCMWTQARCITIVWERGGGKRSVVRLVSSW